jgi:hypothetical protein
MYSRRYRAENQSGKFCPTLTCPLAWTIVAAKAGFNAVTVKAQRDRTVLERRVKTFVLGITTAPMQESGTTPHSSTAVACPAKPITTAFKQRCSKT